MGMGRRTIREVIMKPKIKVVMFIFTFVLFIAIVLKVGIGESYINYTMKSFFESIYNFKSSSINQNSSWEETVNFIETQTDLLCSKSVKETFLHKYLHLLNIAYIKELSLAVKEVTFTKLSGFKTDKVYAFVVKVSIYNQYTNEALLLTNEGQIQLKQSFLNYKISSLKMSVDQVRDYLSTLD